MKFELIFNGQNFLVRLDGEKKKHGFFKTVRVEANSLEEAELKGVELLRQDEQLLALTMNGPGDGPMLFLDSHKQLSSDEALDFPAGATWYPEDD